ncbi:hypothetical protein T265_02018 [Opisthorchis viverrini]|uniref:Uncharacterized protein n=1 Tax=Opisthorchis viverrini TaxID=6198 RepID=A0A075A7X7_OPIVI|nr:hypothetical protein T265_02018 [Opisthorchis viverrini]KER31785.1 hypothetical protein T265_02018 [Opisthorchis viverrini]
MVSVWCPDKVAKQNQLEFLHLSVPSEREITSKSKTESRQETEESRTNRIDQALSIIKRGGIMSEACKYTGTFNGVSKLDV